MNVLGFYVIGDVVGFLMFVYKVEYEGVICIENIVGVLGVYFMDYCKIFGCIYCNLQVVLVGLIEEKVKVEGCDIWVGWYQFNVNGKVIVFGEDNGLIKVIFDKNSGELFGVYMCGVEVIELIQGFVVVMNLEIIEEELMYMIFLYLILLEMMKELVFDVYGCVLNV